MSEETLTREQVAILDHTVHRAAGGFYCGGGKAMDGLVEAGMMASAGRKSFVPEPYYTITSKGRAALKAAKAAQGQRCIVHPDRPAVKALNVPCAVDGKNYVCAECARPENLKRVFEAYRAAHGAQIAGQKEREKRGAHGSN